MRFERLQPTEQMKFLTKLYTRLNAELFEGSLKGIPVTICDDLSEPNAAGFFHKPHPLVSHDNEYIAITHGFIEDSIKPCKYQWHQVVMLTTILLHEMIHEYCYENNIDDTNHNERWQAEAEKRHLHSPYMNGRHEASEEYLDPILVMTMIKNIRIN